MSIVEQLHLLLLRPDGRLESAAGAYRVFGEIAAVIVDLALHDRVEVVDGKHPTVRVTSSEPTGDTVLDAALTRLVPLSGARLDELLLRWKLDPLEDLVASLVDKGILVRGERGLFGWRGGRTPEADAAPERMLRARLAEVIAGSAPPTAADLTLLTILRGLGVAHAILRAESGGLSATELEKRIDELAVTTPVADDAGDAVAIAVAIAASAMVAASMSAVVIAAVVS